MVKLWLWRTASAYLIGILQAEKQNNQSKKPTKPDNNNKTQRNSKQNNKQTKLKKVLHLQTNTLLWFTSIWLKPDIRVLILSCNCLKKEKERWNESWKGTREDDVSSVFLLMCCRCDRNGELSKDDPLRAVVFTNGQKNQIHALGDSSISSNMSS